MRSVLMRVLRAERHELPALAWAFAYFFLLLASYYMLRPVRDSLAVEMGSESLKRLFTVTFAAMIRASGGARRRCGAASRRAGARAAACCG